MAWDRLRMIAKSAKPEQPIMAFASAAAFRRWLGANHAAHPGIWMRIGRKDGGFRGITYAEALEEALCHGWIDGQRKSHDSISFLQKFTRRGARSVWSKINAGHIERLTRAGRMHPAGHAAVEAARADGRWERAYHSAREAEVPADFLAALAGDAKAEAFFKGLNKSNRYAICFRLATAAKPETRARRLAKFVAMMKRGEKFH